MAHAMTTAHHRNHPSQQTGAPRQTCEQCGKSVALYVGRNGYTFQRPHNRAKGDQCFGSHEIVRSIPKRLA